MKLRGNIISGARLAASVLKYNKNAREIESARSKGDIDLEKRLIAEATGSWVNDLIQIFDLTLNISGRENIPDEPCVFIANHQAYCDVPAMLKATEGIQLGFIAKEAFKPVPILAKWILITRGLFIPKDDPRESLKVISQGAEYVKQGFNMCIFPEGKRSFGPEMNPFKPGALKLATKAKVPVVPVTIDGTYRTFEENLKITKGQTASVIIHPAINTAELSRSELADLPTEVEKIIRGSLSHK